MTAPFFSIVVPLYNKAPYIAKTLESVLAQGFEDYEVIVVNDGSKDKGAEVVREFAGRDPRIKLIDQENNGVSRARNRGIEEASGRYIAFLDADDWWEPNHLSELKTLTEFYPGAGMFGTAYRSKYKKRAVELFLSRYRNKRLLLENYFKYLVEAQFIYTSSIAIARYALDQVGTFPEEETHFAEDRHLWNRVALKYPVAYSGTVTVNYNCTATGQATSREKGQIRTVSTIYPLSVREHLESGCLDSETITCLHAHANRYILDIVSYLILAGKPGHAQLKQFIETVHPQEWVTGKLLRRILVRPAAPWWKPFFYFRTYIASGRLSLLLFGRYTCKRVSYVSTPLGA